MSNIAAQGYRYFTTLLYTDPTATEPNPIIAELPFTGVNFTKQINSIGTFEGHLLLSGIDSFALNVDEGTQPAKTALYIDFNGTLVWGGVIWGREYNSADQTLTVHAQEFESYFDKRFINDTYIYFETEIETVITDLMNAAQNPTGYEPFNANGNIGVIVPAPTNIGVLVTRTYHSYELKSYYQAILDLSRNDISIDFHIDTSYDIATLRPKKTFKMGFPTGSIYSATADPSDFPAITGVNNYVFEFPGNIVEYSFPEDGASAANVVWALGAGSNEGKLIVKNKSTARLSNDWPLLEGVYNYTEIANTKLLAQLAIGRLKAVSLPPVTMRIVIPSYIEPTFGTSYEIGDVVNVRINDDRFPGVRDPSTGLLIPGGGELNANYRIVGLNVTPGEDGPDRITITLTLPIDQPGA